MIRVITTSLFIALALTLHAQGWKQQQSNTVNQLNSVHFVDVNHGAAAGYNGTILKTSDGGDHWFQQTSGTNETIEAIHFTDTLIGFAVTNKQLLKTIDGGNNWAIQDTITDGQLSTIFFIDQDTGFIAGYKRLLKTVDGGNTWSKQYASNIFIKCLWATSSDNLYLGGENLMVIKSSDGGIMWELFSSAVGGIGLMESMFFTSPNTGYFIGGNYAQGNTSGIVRKYHNGQTSSYQSIDTQNKWWYSVYFTDSLTGYMSSQDGSIMKTINAGVTWTKQNSGVTSSLLDIFFIDSTTGYAVGSLGKIIKTTNGGNNTSVIFKNQNFTIYPNPTSITLTVFSDYDIESIRICDITGKILFSSSQKTNEIDISQFAAGNYLITVSTSKETSNAKFVKQ